MRLIDKFREILRRDSDLTPEMIRWRYRAAAETLWDFSVSDNVNGEHPDTIETLRNIVRCKRAWAQRLVDENWKTAFVVLCNTHEKAIDEAERKGESQIAKNSRLRERETRNWSVTRLITENPPRTKRRPS